MCQPNRVRDDEVTVPLLLPRNSHQKLHFLNKYSQAISISANEAISIVKISFLLVITSLILYFRSFVSLYFLGHIGDAALAGGSLGLASANITGYSVFSGLTMGVESICAQAFGARRKKLFVATIRRGIILLLFSSLPVTLVWFNMEKILVFLRQNKDLATEAQTFINYSVPDLIAQSFLHPLRVYFRTKSKTLPLFICTLVASVLHYPITTLFVSYLNLGIKGVALSGVATNFNLVAFLLLYIAFYESREVEVVEEEEEEEEIVHSVKEWTKLLRLALPSCFSVCLEWWCYEVMILACGRLLCPQATVASMGILIQMTSLVYILPSSLSFGVSTRVGNELGSNQPGKARTAATVGLGLSIVLGLTALFFTVSVRNFWPMFFTVDTNITALVSMALPIVGLCELGNCTQTTGCGILRGSARPGIGALINISAFYLVGMTVGGVMAFVFEFGFKGLWLGMLAAQITCVIGMMVVTCRTDWELEAVRAQTLTAVNGVEAVRARTLTAVNGGGNDDDDGNDGGGDQEDVEVGRLIIG